MAWILAALLAITAFVFWQQLLKWKAWKDQMKAWVTAYQTWVTVNCTCNAPEPPAPPDPPSWPNGGW
ncbi:MAG TPA: hypothetical protein VK849_04515 [Longimicrobiales bacterium]|nr:hypothetical protein [Longimicrobiales bacterium]